MFDIRKFGASISRLRKQADMTQSELADKLNLTRQAVSRYELGDSFPDVSILVLIAEIFGVTLDELVAGGNPTFSESRILTETAKGGDPVAENVSDLIALAPYLKPSILDKLSATLSVKGIDISNIIGLAEYLSDESVLEMLKKADFTTLDEKLLTKLIPLLDGYSKGRIFEMILEGEMDWHMLYTLLPYYYICSEVEAAVIDGAFPKEALDLMRQARLLKAEMDAKREGKQ